MVTVSVTTVANTVRSLSDRHDADVISWASNLLMNIDVSQMHNVMLYYKYNTLDGS